MSRVAVVERDVDEVGVERVAHLVAELLDQGVQVQLAGQRLADGVDDGELGGPLAGLVDEAGVVERHAQAGGERRQQVHVRLA